MQPSEYYYRQFRGHFNLFWNSLRVNGTCSRIGEQQMRGGIKLGNSLVTTVHVSSIEGDHFSIGDLILFTDRELPDHLASIPHEYHPDFLCSLFYTVLIDQIMYTHFSPYYEKFRELTLYPKMDLTFSLAGPYVMANPYEIFSSEIINSRSISEEHLISKFGSWVEFIVLDLDLFFKENRINNLSWHDIRQAILNDPDCVRGEYGSIFRAVL